MLELIEGERLLDKLGLIDLLIDGESEAEGLILELIEGLIDLEILGETLGERLKLSEGEREGLSE
jgi:hypothetical protein